MGAGNSKSAAADTAPAPPNGAASSADNGGRSAAAAARDEAIGMVIDGIVLYGMYVTATFLYKMLKPMFEEFREGKGNKSKLQRRLDRTGRKMFHTNHYEEIIAGDIVDPHDIDVSFADIGGLEHQKRDIHDLIVLPLKNPAFFASRGKLLKAPKGILLYGKPGTGKTMLAKAIAKESGAFFIDLKISTIMSKWFGESQKLVRAAFSLAQKLAPCIIFIDEVDSFMGKRGGMSDPTFASMKTEFLALWDGFTEMNNTESGFGVIVMGATNRPGDVDPAFLRRMPRTFEIGLPDQHQREQILRINLKNETVDREFNFRQLSADTVYYSGSDLKELCRAALMIPLREHIEQVKCAPTPMPSGPEGEIATEPEIAMRPLSMADFDEAKQMVQPTGATAYAYEAAQEDEKPQSRPGSAPIDTDLFAAIMAAGLQNMMQFSNQQNNHRHTQ